MEQIDNNRIAMSLLRQCAWVWENCTRNPNEGEFKLSEILRGIDKASIAEKSAPGMMMIDYDSKCWDTFNKYTPIEGLTFNRETMVATLEFGSFRCHYLLDRYIFGLTAKFCKMNCPSIANKVRFWYKDGERGVWLPESNAKRAKTKNKTISCNTKTKKKNERNPLSLAEQLRAAFLARLSV